ncbi:response regulator transcription factor [Opitutus sp. GAS368]|uniref:response regulator transcription factor n=1 Tax=Opitutus sp. GAS368 TaxID=1882749 RepID=UPI00087C5AF0|nr:response regulator transcription factor [Opitutus sp. GAS368]SDS04401.1 two component transcriptional regulator, LuxR family [Opitutus sp. GAS368]
MSKDTPLILPVQTGTRIFLVDDHPLVREWLGSLIERQADLGICGQAEDSASAFREISRLKPDVVIVDLSLQGESGLELIKQLQTLHPVPRVLVLSMHDEAFYAERTLRAGAHGYVMKRAATGKVIEAIRKILSGQIYLSESLAARIAQKFIGSSAQPGESLMSTLSDREVEIFRFIGQGYETKHIAEKLHLSLKTVQTYCGRIKDKLALANATALTHEAVRWYEHEQRNA